MWLRPLGGVFYYPDSTLVLELCYNDEKGVFRAVTEAVLMNIPEGSLEELLLALASLLKDILAVVHAIVALASA